MPGVAVGLVMAAAWVRVADPSWYPLGGVEPLVYTIADECLFVALLAGIPPARRGAAVEPIVAMRRSRAGLQRSGQSS